MRLPNLAYAWTCRATATRRGRHAEEIVAVDFDAGGRMLERVAVGRANGSALVFHCMTPPSAKTLRETGLTG